jgi:hypothetical protein
LEYDLNERKGGRAGASSKAQIIAALKQVEGGRKVEDVAREQGGSKQTIYVWKRSTVTWK